MIFPSRFGGQETAFGIGSVTTAAINDKKVGFCINACFAEKRTILHCQCVRKDIETFLNKKVASPILSFTCL